MDATQRVHLFTEEPGAVIDGLQKEGRSLEDLLGGKGANLMLMTNAGIPVPLGFTIGTDACIEYCENGRQVSPDLQAEIERAMGELEASTGREFGDPSNPLLVSVRSGPKFRMPGMMDAVLNLGMNDEVAEAMIRLSGDERFVYDSYRRLIVMFANSVKCADREAFEEALTAVKAEEGVKEDVDVSTEGLKKIVEMEKVIYEREVGEPFPNGPMDQLMLAVEAAFSSWDDDRAITYREIHGIPQNLGTAVSVQVMVFGNLGNGSGTGVAFTRNPATGEKEIYGEFLFNAQGEDVVAGLRTPRPVGELEREMPEILQQFIEICVKLEQLYRDMQDVEFTVEQGKLWTLQTRDGSRTSRAAIRIAVDLLREGAITEKEAVLRVTPCQLLEVLMWRLKAGAQGIPLVRGEGVVPGVAEGVAVFSDEAAQWYLSEGEPIIFVHHWGLHDDARVPRPAAGILVTDDATSRAAMTGRARSVPTVASVDYIWVTDREAGMTMVGRRWEVCEGQAITIDGGTGHVYLGALPDEHDECLAHYVSLLTSAGARFAVGHTDV